MEEVKKFDISDLMALRAGLSVICGSVRGIKLRRKHKEALALYDSGAVVRKEETDPDVYEYYCYLREVGAESEEYARLEDKITALKKKREEYASASRGYKERAAEHSRENTLELMKKILAVIVCCAALVFAAVFIYALASSEVSDVFVLTMTGIAGFVVCAAMLIPIVAKRGTSNAALAKKYERLAGYADEEIAYESGILKGKKDVVKRKEYVEREREFLEKHLDEKAKEEGEKSRLVYRAFVRIFEAKGIDESLWADTDAMIAKAQRGEEPGEDVAFADVYTTMGTVLYVCVYSEMQTVYDEYKRICERECGSADESVCFTLSAFSTALGTEKDRSSKDLVATLEEIKKSNFVF